MSLLQRIVVPALIGLAVASCASSGSSSGVSVQDAQSTHPGVTGLARSFTIHETRRGSGTTQVVGDVRVDYDSEIVVKPDLAALARLAVGSSAPIAEPATDLQRELGLLLEEIEAYTQAALVLSGSERTAGVVIADDPQWTEAAQRELALVRRMKELTFAMVAEERSIPDARWRNGPDAVGLSEDDYRARYEAALAAVAELQSRLAPVVDGQLVVDPVAVSTEVNELMEKQRRRLHGLQEVAKSSAVEHELVVTAELLRGKEPYPVGVAPYSVVEGQARGEKSARVSLPKGRDLERLEEEYVVVEKFARSIERTRELIGDPAKFAAALKELAPKLEAYLQEAQKRLATRLKEVAAAAQPELAEVVQAAKAVQAALETLVQRVKALVQDAPRLTPPAVLRAASEIEGLVHDGLGKSLEELGTKIKAVSISLPPIVAELATLARTELDEIGEALANTAFGGSLGGLIGSLRQMRMLARSEGFGALKPGTVTRKPFAIGAAPDGTIQLADSPAEADDLLRITYELKPKSAAAGETPTAWTESTLLDIRKFGFYTTFNSQVLFADRIGDGSSRYQAAAGIGVNLHYRPESGRTFFDVVAPGVGICVAAPSFENGVELAVGLQATVFNDTIQAGYLYDISVEDDPWAFYFGLDLIQAFRKFQ